MLSVELLLLADFLQTLEQLQSSVGHNLHPKELLVGIFVREDLGQLRYELSGSSFQIPLSDLVIILEEGDRQGEEFHLLDLEDLLAYDTSDLLNRGYVAQWNAWNMSFTLKLTRSRDLCGILGVLIEQILSQEDLRGSLDLFQGPLLSILWLLRDFDKRLVQLVQERLVLIKLVFAELIDAEYFLVEEPLGLVTVEIGLIDLKEVTDVLGSLDFELAVWNVPIDLIPVRIDRQRDPHVLFQVAYEFLSGDRLHDAILLPQMRELLNDEGHKHVVVVPFVLVAAHLSVMDWPAEAGVVELSS